MTDFFRFPHTPHLAWLGAGSPRDDKVMSPAEARSLLAGEVVVEEKLDGANLGISAGSDGVLRFQNRGQYLQAPFSGQFARLASWLPAREAALADALGESLILFGEWCAARHSLDYTELPDWFLAFDVYDRKEGCFWSTTRRNILAGQLDICTVPPIFIGKATLEDLKAMVLKQPSRFSSGSLEGIIIRREDADFLETRAKLVHPDFTQAITEHWSRRGMEWNRLGQALNERRKEWASELLQAEPGLADVADHRDEIGPSANS
ncbi:MAG: RNA ligase family protein [Verrucomicrobia bacterium]|nr:RNA ligase family protein [Verrucomicrobiota bacterium]